MRRNRLALFRLDLSFWWYYLAQFLLTALCYGDVILQAMNVSLPFNADVAFFVFYIAALLAQFALFCLFENKVQVIPDILGCLLINVQFFRCVWNGDLDKSRELAARE